MPPWAQSCLWAVKHDSAAMPTSSKTNPSPICLSSSGFGKNAFHRATDKQNSRWASRLHSLPLILEKTSSSRLATRAEHISHCCLFYPLPLLWITGQEITFLFICITLCSDTRVRAAYQLHLCMNVFSLQHQWNEGLRASFVNIFVNTHERWYEVEVDMQTRPEAC